MDYTVVMPYIGARLSVNSMKIVKRGQRTHRNFPEVDNWMLELASKVEHLRGKVKPPITVKLFGCFRDDRRPDMDNLLKVVCDGLKKGIGVDDKHFISVIRGFRVGVADPELVITLEWTGKEV